VSDFNEFRERIAPLVGGSLGEVIEEDSKFLRVLPGLHLGHCLSLRSQRVALIAFPVRPFALV